MENVQWHTPQVLNAVNQHLTKLEVYATGCEGVVEGLGDVAAVLAARDGADAAQVEELRNAVSSVLEARRRAQLHTAALQDLKGRYEATGEATDFAAELEQRAEAAGAAQPYSVEEDALYRDFQAAAAGGDGDRQEDEEDEQVDDDLVVVGGAAQLAPNENCPITGRALLLIKDPVEDAIGVVYEREAVVHYFRNLAPSKRGRSIIMAGSSHEVTLSELKSSEKIIKAKKKAAKKVADAARRGTQQQQQGGGGGEDVLEV